MKISNTALWALLVPAVSSRFVEDTETDPVTIPIAWAKEADAATQRYHIELAPGETRWVTEDEKWELRRVCTPSNFLHLAH